MESNKLNEIKRKKNDADVFADQIKNLHRAVQKRKKFLRLEGKNGNMNLYSSYYGDDSNLKGITQKLCYFFRSCFPIFKYVKNYKYR